MCDTHRHSGSRASRRLSPAAAPSGPGQRLDSPSTGVDPAKSPLAGLDASPGLRAQVTKSPGPAAQPQRPAAVPAPAAATAPEEAEPVSARPKDPNQNLRDIIKASAQTEQRLKSKDRGATGNFAEQTLSALVTELWGRAILPKELRPNYRGHLLQGIRGALDDRLGPQWREGDCPEFLHRKKGN